jgi:hypothetical protein
MTQKEGVTLGYRDLPDDAPVAFLRVADQIDFFDKKSKQNQTTYKLLKFITLFLAAVITVSGAVTLPGWVVPVLGASVVIVEGVIQLNAMVQNWLSYRNTCESLKQEKYLALSKAGPYMGENEPARLLAERTEAILGKERSSWTAAQEGNLQKLKVGADAGS